MDLVKFLAPKHVVLVHGEKPKMASLKAKIESEIGSPCYYPANNETVSVPTTQFVKATASNAFLRATSNPNFKFFKKSAEDRLEVTLLTVFWTVGRHKGIEELLNALTPMLTYL